MLWSQVPSPKKLSNVAGWKRWWRGRSAEEGQTPPAGRRHRRGIGRDRRVEYREERSSSEILQPLPTSHQSLPPFVAINNCFVVVALLRCAVVPPFRTDRAKQSPRHFFCRARPKPKPERVWWHCNPCPSARRPCPPSFGRASKPRTICARRAAPAG